MTSTLDHLAIGTPSLADGRDRERAGLLAGRLGLAVELA
jgi:hypothetical protein